MLVLDQPIEKVIKMTESEFRKFSHDTKGEGFSNIFSTAQGLVLFGPYGVYAVPSKTDSTILEPHFFSHPTDIHVLVKSWGFRRLVHSGIAQDL
jgi:hypothetical protein